MADWFVYIVKCKNNTLYTGITIDVERRLEEHRGEEGKGAKYLRGKGPLKLVFQERVGSKSNASKIEMKIKRLSRLKKIQILQGNLKVLELIPEESFEEE